MVRSCPAVDVTSFMLWRQRPRWRKPSRPLSLVAMPTRHQLQGAGQPLRCTVEDLVGGKGRSVTSFRALGSPCDVLRDTDLAHTYTSPASGRWAALAMSASGARPPCGARSPASGRWAAFATRGRAVGEQACGRHQLQGAGQPLRPEGGRTRRRIITRSPALGRWAAIAISPGGRGVSGPNLSSASGRWAALANHYLYLVFRVLAAR